MARHVVYSVEQVLEPLGGPDNLRLMCGATDLFMAGHNEVKFKIKNEQYTIKRGLSLLSKSDFWNIEKISTETLICESRSYIFDTGLVVRIFERFSCLSLSF
jgi:hypothetical protein